MKRVTKILGVILFSVYLLLPIKAHAQEQLWGQKLDLNDSVSSSIVKVEDGIIIMQYEGTASTNNLLIKYDFDGNKIWQIKNDYGYSIESVSDGFIIWNENTMTKFDKDKNIKWQRTLENPLNGFYNADKEIIEISDGYIIYEKGQSSITKLDFQGNIISTTQAGSDIKAAALTLDGNGIAILLSSNSDYPDYTPCYTFIILDSNLDKIKQTNYEYSNDVERNMSFSNNINNIIAIEDGYLLSGKQMILLDNEGKIKKTFNNTTLDIKQIGDYIYIYEVLNGDTDKYYNTAIVKYDKNLNKQITTELPLSFYSESLPSTGMSTGFARIKNRVVYYENDNQVDSIVLNTPILSIAYGKDHKIDKDVVKGWPDTIGNNFILKDSSSYVSYGVARYRVSEISETKEDNGDNSGIINNILKNPQTNSIIIIAVFIIIILMIEIISCIANKSKINQKRK